MNSNNSNNDDTINYSNFDYNDDNDDNENYEHIRAPDPVVRERLIENNYYNYNYTYNHKYTPTKYDTDFENDARASASSDMNTDDMILEAILKQSKEEYENEQQQKDLLRLERFKLKEFYSGIKNKINRIKCYDTSNQEIFEKILNIIEKYEKAEINYFNVGQDIFDKMFIILTSLRMTPSEMEFFRKLIIV
jgi:Rps23 Pro-64 3,4-dihydroxylase Tpa1-like proline 4-hydroxylase